VLLDFSSHFWKGVTLASVEANGQESVLIPRDGEPVGLVTTDAFERGINQIMWITIPN
jgi:RNA polymerase sigma-70 factor (ECF subfamily)